MSTSRGPMEEARDARRDLWPHPPLAAVPGLVLMAIALLVDVVAHAGVLASLEAPAHLLGVLGMVLVWIAVVVDGVHRTRRPR